MNDVRAKAAEAALEAFIHHTKSDPESAIGDLIANIAHLADRKEHKYGTAYAGLVRGLGHYATETSMKGEEKLMQAARTIASRRT
jgi:hypothetical protein